MKRGRDDEKMLKPMFPRLHVNDKEKGGPRAPPRNKMALYEQLSIPSQRFNHHNISHLDLSNRSSSVPFGSTNQSDKERNLQLLHQVASSACINLAKDFCAEKPLREGMTSSLAQYNQMEKEGKEDDFMVPVFVNSEIAKSNSKIKNEIDRKKGIPSAALSSCISIQIKEIGADSQLKNGLYAEICLEVEEQGEESQKTLLSANSRNLFGQDDCEPGVKVNSKRDIDDGTEAKMRSESHSGDEVEDEQESYLGKEYTSPHLGNGDASDGVSGTSMVDSGSNLDNSPDDIVAILGQKHFWKARRAIANQQRVFAVQVFELHKLIKVQRVLAGSPHLLYEDGTHLSKASSKTSPAMKLLPVEYVIKSLPHDVERKDEPEKADKKHRMECSAENAVGSKINQHQPSNCAPILGDSPSAAAAAAAAAAASSAAMDGSRGSWCFPPQPTPGNHQWLIPVMSPSEGLIYKPYPAPASDYPGSIYGGQLSHCIPIPMPGSNFMGPVYGIPTPYPQGHGFPATGHGYFPGCGMSSMNPNLSGHPMEQMNRFGHPHYPPFTSPAQKNETVNSTLETESRPGNKEGSGLQGSTGSSPRDRVAHTIGNSPGKAVGRFHTVPMVETVGNLDGDRLRQASVVIRVVPRNPRLATESAARIFRSIQEERQQSDSA